MEVPQSVRPRKTSTGFLQLIVASAEDNKIWVERTGEIHPLEDAASLVTSEPSSYWIVPNASMMLAELDRRFSDVDSWQFRGSPRKRELWAPKDHNMGRMVVSDFVVAFFGFQRPGGRKGHYHYPIDPRLFMRQPGHTIGGTGLDALIAWGRDMRDWCVAEGLTPKPTAGGIAGQLLRDERFYPGKRRKVPKATNGRGRMALPGNHYRLYAETGKNYKHATYLDLSAAHHNAALNITFPHADGLYARGRFKVTDETLASADPVKAWARPGSKLYEKLLTRAHGLLLVHLTVPTMAPGSFPLPYLETPGRTLAWVHTNEITDLLASRAIIEGIEAAWVSFKPDTGLNRYAAWALGQTAAATAERKAWLKPVLLATYGVLASKPRAMEFAYAKANGGERKTYPAGGDLISAVAKSTLTENEMSTANVIHRGMIEAETRLEVLKLARYLHASGCTVLSVYADSVIVEGGTLPLLPGVWRSKGTLSNLRFYNATSFVSNEMVKLPGIPLEAREREKRLKDFARGLDTRRRSGSMRVAGHKDPDLILKGKTPWLTR